MAAVQNLYNTDINYYLPSVGFISRACFSCIAIKHKREKLRQYFI